MMMVLRLGVPRRVRWGRPRWVRWVKEVHGVVQGKNTSSVKMTEEAKAVGRYRGRIGQNVRSSPTVRCRYINDLILERSARIGTGTLFQFGQNDRINRTVEVGRKRSKDCPAETATLNTGTPSPPSAQYAPGPPSPPQRGRLRIRGVVTHTLGRAEW